MNSCSKGQVLLHVFASFHVSFSISFLLSNLNVPSRSSASHQDLISGTSLKDFLRIKSLLWSPDKSGIQKSLSAFYLL